MGTLLPFYGMMDLMDRLSGADTRGIKVLISTIPYDKDVQMSAFLLVQANGFLF